jgi:mono/diheme cytochrome c family protein
MRQMNKWMWIVGSPALIAGCAISDDLLTSKAPTEPLALTAGVRVGVEGILSYGAVAFAENPTTLLESNDFHGYEFDGKAGGNITITMNGSSCGAPDTLLDLFSPEDASENRAFLSENDDAGLGPCTLDARIANFTLPTTGRYLVVATSFLQAGGNGHYKLQLTCNNNACVDPTAPTFAASQISQAAAAALSADELFEIGDFMFEHMFTVPEGLGNALVAAPANNTPRPNFRPFPNNVHFAAFGAPEAQSCVSCHNVGGDDGAGDNNHNIFQIGDGINRASGVPRNPPPVLGSGLRQRIGEEMTAELQGQLASGKAQAIATNSNVTVLLRGKGRNFGSVVAKPDGTVDFALLNPGIDSDLVVKPFGWKGREATIRRFIEGGFRVHFGMQTEVQVNKQCPNVNLLGTGACPDPDGDGVVNEITEGLLSAEAIYMGLLETPVRVPAPTAAAQTRVNAGEVLFNQVGCAGCHTQNMTINSPIHVEPADTVGGPGITVNLATDTKDPHPALNADGTMTVEIWSDFKRHNMGSATDQTDCDTKDFNQINKCFFMTPPLWGIRNTAPYLHDGRAATLQDSILLHGAGDDAGSVAAFKALSADDQSKIVEFMNSLGRQEDKDAAPVDLSNFRIEQTGSLLEKTIPAGTSVPHGGFLIVGRNATQAQFEANYGVVLGPTVKYVNGGNAFPIIDGGETFTLFDTQSVLIDGRSIAEPAGGLRTFSRVRCDVAPSLAASWSSAATSNAVASPGRGPLPTGQNRICVTEVADSANTNFEYVEIFVE